MEFTFLVPTNQQNIRKKESKILESAVQILSQFFHLVTEAHYSLLLFFFFFFPYNDFEKIKIIFAIPVRAFRLMPQTCNLSLGTNRGEQRTCLGFQSACLHFTSQ